MISRQIPAAEILAPKHMTKAKRIEFRMEKMEVLRVERIEFREKR